MRRALLLLTALTTTAQVYTPGPQVLTFFSDVDDSDQPYALYLPKNLDWSKKYPLVISLHGAGSNHRLNLRRVFGRGNQADETDGEATRRFPAFKDVAYIVASPLARGTMGYQGVPEKDVYDVLADVKKRFPVDEDRIYLTGLSMGGGGALWLGLTRPDLWAAIAPVCPAAPAGTEELAGNALNLPIKMFQGDSDPVVHPEGSRGWAKRLGEAGADVEYVEFPGVRHNSWDLAYRDGAIFSWFDKQRRVRYPGRVRFSTREYRYASAYWVRIDAMTPGQLASFDGEFPARNTINVRTGGLDGFTLLLKGHPHFVRSQAMTITVDGRSFTSKGADEISFARSQDGWARRRYLIAAGEKRPGVSGPVPDVIASRHLYVYGTGGNPTPEELKVRRDQAAYAAEWSSARSRLLLSFRAIADEEVREADLASSNLVLFGTRETNRLIARVAMSMPFELNPGAADYGVVMAVPFGERMAVVNSGLPWWTRADQARRAGMTFIPVPFRALQSFEDYIVFKGGLDNVVVEGRFDRRWRLPPDAAARLRGSGAVVVK